jgi:hypothetical protein
MLRLQRAAVKFTASLVEVIPLSNARPRITTALVNFEAGSVVEIGLEVEEASTTPRV